MIIHPKEKAFIFYSDPGHGWLRVRRDTLLALGDLATQISTSSYENGNFVYLEEDCDAGLFLKAYRKTGIAHFISEVNNQGTSRIRNYAPFKLTEAERQQVGQGVTLQAIPKNSSLLTSLLGEIR